VAWFILLISLLLGCKAYRLDREDQYLLESAESVGFVSLDQFISELKSGLEHVQLDAELSSDIVVRPSKEHSLFIPKECGMSLQLGREGLFKMLTRGTNCPGMEVAIPNLPKVKLFEWEWNIINKQFKGRTNPEWSSFILNGLSPWINRIVVPNLPKSIDVIAKSFELGRPEEMLDIFWTILGETPESIKKAKVNPLKNVHLRTVSASHRDLKVKLEDYSLFIAKDSKIEFSANLNGPHRNSTLGSFYFAPGNRAGMTSKRITKNVGALLGSMAVVYIETVRVDSPEEYVIIMGPATGSSEWKFKHSKGIFTYAGDKRSDSTVNKLLLREGQGALKVFRQLLKETRGIFPILLPDNLFQSL
jgi:hypothetical protein